MRFVMFYHSLLSDWNHGNAHFLRGVVAELQARGHEVVVYEPRDGWSLSNLVKDYGEAPLAAFRQRYPGLDSRAYELEGAGALDLDEALRGADVVVVHEWSEPALVGAIGAHRRAHDYLLLFHDTHHRAVSDPGSLAKFDLSGYDGVLAFGQILRDLYLERGWAKRAFIWHEAADTRLFNPPPGGRGPFEGDLVWVGNWGDDERTAELEEFLLEPVRALGLKATIHGVRYPEHAREALARAGIQYAGWLPNFDVPGVFAKHRVTVHVPRRPYVQALHGIPTIRPFEAMACEIPLVSAPWNDSEGLFEAGRDYLVARDGAEMKRHLARLLSHPEEAATLARAGRRAIEARHTCAHRTDELLGFVGKTLAEIRTTTADTRAA
jgi:spore maturation protein CgeB